MDKAGVIIIHILERNKKETKALRHLSDLYKLRSHTRPRCLSISPHQQMACIKKFPSFPVPPGPNTFNNVVEREH